MAMLCANVGKQTLNDILVQTGSANIEVYVLYLGCFDREADRC